MKTSVKLLFVAAAVTSILSCTKNLGEIKADAQSNNVKAVVSANLNDMSKASLDGLKLSWEAGDELMICQYGKYDASHSRDYTKNKFVYNSATGKFEGEIAGYQLPAEGSAYYERFYTGTPYSNISGIGGGTGRFILNVSDKQSGKIADFGKYATYLGYQRQREAEKPLTSYKDGVITFLNPFDMVCTNPVLKFTVPASLSLSQIEVSAFKGTTPANIAGTIDCRCDTKALAVLPAVDKITISDGENLISGDVYVVLAPNAKTPDADTKHNYMSDITSIVLDLTKDDGATASLKLTLAGDAPASGVVKNLKSLPESINWTYPAGPGIATIGFTGNAGNAGRFEVTAEKESSTLKYASSTVSYDEVGEPTGTIPSNGIARGDYGITYVRFCTTTGALSPRIENAMVWGFSGNQGFGKAIKAKFNNNTVGASYTYAALTYTITVAGNTYAYPYCQSAGINYMNDKQPDYSRGYLNFTVLENGTGRLMVQSNGQGSSVSVTNVTKSASISKSLTSSQGIVVTDEFAVSKGDVIKVEFSAFVQVQSMSFVWETATAD